MMGKNIASVDDRIAHSLVGVVDAYLGAKAPSQAFRCACLHLVEVLEVCLNAVVPVGRGGAFASLHAHLCLFSIVGIGLPGFDELECEVVQGLEVVRGVGNSIAVNVQELQVLENSVFKLCLRRVSG